MPAKMTTNAKNLIYFHTVYTAAFFSYTYRSLYSFRFFSTAILLSSWQFAVTKPQLVKKIKI